MDKSRGLLLLEGTEEEIPALWYRGPVILAATLFALLVGMLHLLAFLGLRSHGLVMDMEHRVSFTTELAPRPFLLFLGIWFCFLAYQQWLKKAAALYVLIGLLFIQASCLFLLYYEPWASALLLTLPFSLWHYREEFPVRPNPRSLRRLRIAAPAFLAALIASEWLSLWLLRGALGLEGGPLRLLRYCLGMMAGDVVACGLQGWGTLVCRSCTLITCLGILWCTSLLFRPHEDTCSEDAEKRHRARELVRSYGSDTIAYFNLRDDKNLFFLGDEAFLAYRCLGGTALVTGDPVGPPTCLLEIMARFRNYCLERGWRLACLGVGTQHLHIYSRVGLKRLCYGEEAVIHLDEFTLKGRRNKSLRHAVHKWERAGARMEFMFNASIPSHLRHELGQISADWRGDNPETGFSMGLGRLLRSEDPDCLLAVAYDAQDSPIGFAYLVPVYRGLGYSLDITRISCRAPNGLNEFIFAKTALFLKKRGYRILSLHFAAFSQHYRKDRQEEGSAVIRFLCRLADTFLPVMSLYRFDRKFQPRWQPRYLVFESYLDLPRLGIAAISAESFYRLARRRRRPSQT